jgi:hypothetical protein
MYGQSVASPFSECQSIHTHIYTHMHTYVHGQSVASAISECQERCARIFGAVDAARQARDVEALVKSKVCCKYACIHLH